MSGSFWLLLVSDALEPAAPVVVRGPANADLSERVGTAHAIRNHALHCPHLREPELRVRGERRTPSCPLLFDLSDPGRSGGLRTGSEPADVSALKGRELQAFVIGVVRANDAL